MEQLVRWDLCGRAVLVEDVLPPRVHDHDRSYVSIARIVGNLARDQRKSIVGEHSKLCVARQRECATRSLPLEVTSQGRRERVENLETITKISAESATSMPVEKSRKPSLMRLPS